MARRSFILRCKQTANDCTRLLLSDNAGSDTFNSTLTRMETLRRSMEWTRGRLSNETAADELLQQVNEYIQEIRAASHLAHDSQASSGYTAPLTWTGARGPPQYAITRGQLEFLMSCGFRPSQMAEILNVSLKTVKRRLRWRIVVHGSIDGYSRLIVFLHASNNNRSSSTVLECFMSAVAKYGVPSRVRTDHGGENNDVCLLMNVFRGSGRGSAIRGTSTHNQRIERLWGDMWRGVINVYHDLFRFLEREGIVDPDNEMHLWALQYVYLPRINRDLNAFTNQWNHHGLRTERHQSPLQIFVRGCLAQQRQPTTSIRDLFATEPLEVAGETDGTAGAMDGGRAEAAGTEGVAAAGEPPDIDWPKRVQVPQTRFTLDAVMTQQLEEQFDPLEGQRVNLGIEIIRDLITYLESRNIH